MSNVPPPPPGQPEPSLPPSAPPPPPAPGAPAAPAYGQPGAPGYAQPGAPGYGQPGPPGYGQAGPPRPYASWINRVVATIIDTLLMYIFLAPGVIYLFVGPTEIVFRSDGLYEQPTGATFGIAILLMAVAGIAYIVLYVRMLGKSGATWGRKAMGYKILDQNTYQPIGIGRAIGRYFARILDGMVCYLGYLWPLWDAENRTFSDMIVSTRAIKD